jgi:6-phosphogluconolactonase
MDFRLEILKDADGVVHRAAEIFVEVAAVAHSQRSGWTVALAGGTTQAALYRLLASSAYRDRVGWEAISFFFGDERAVPPDHPESNFRMANDALFRPLRLHNRQFHRMQGEMHDLAKAAELYEEDLRKAFNGELPRFDLILLGMGPDGHTASLFPGSQTLLECRRWVIPVLGAPKPPPSRLTLTLPVFNAGRKIVFTVAGQNKAAALQEVLHGAASPHDFPAKMIRPGADRLLWIVDQAAASRLTSIA